MSQRQSVINIEFNELCPNLMKRFIEAGELPRFQQFYNEAEIFETDAEESGELLNPWVQWISVHTGLSASEHQITTLSEGHKLESPAVWDVLSASGRRVWVCGSMNSRYDRPLNGYLLPDPWSTGTRSYPDGMFDAYLAYVRSAVQEHTGSGGEGSRLAFLRFMLGHGLSAGTMVSVVRQLLSERLANTRWKRAALLDLFQWDLFRYYYRQIRPDFASFFLNSTAHFQHCYWRNMEPEKFRIRPSEPEQKDHAKAILFGYRNMDDLLGRLMRLADPGTTLIFCTALSQQPYLDHEETGGRHYYHLRAPTVLSKSFGIAEPFTLEPVMAGQFYLRFNNKDQLARAENQLNRFRVIHPAVFRDDRNQVFGTIRKEEGLLVQCRCTADVPRDAQVTAPDEPQVSIPFYEAFYQTDTTKSGRHHPAGMLWIRYPHRQHRVHPTTVSIRSIAPTILQMFSVPVAPRMKTAALPVNSLTSVRPLDFAVG